MRWRRSRPDTVGRILARAVILVGLYQVGLRAMAHWRVVETLLSSGAETPFWQVVVALAFVLLRLYVVLLLGPLTLAQLLLVFGARHRPQAAAAS